MSDHTDTVKREASWPLDADHQAAIEAVETNLRREHDIDHVVTCYASRKSNEWFVSIEATLRNGDGS